MTMVANANMEWFNLFKSKNNLASVYPDYWATTGNWSPDSAYRASLKKFTPNSQYDMSSRLCGNEFFPAHPMANTKEYHAALYKRFDTSKLPASSVQCRVTSNGSRKYCLAAGSLKFVVISDTFFDICGNYFRGYWVAAYNSDHDNLGTLMAKGRTVEPVPNSQFRNDFRPSNTYVVNKSNFLFLSPLFKGDRIKIKEAVSSSKKYYNLVLRNRIFEKRR